MKGDDRRRSKAKSKALGSGAGAVRRGPVRRPAAAAGDAAAGKPADDVVDAEFTEVKDDDKP